VRSKKAVQKPRMPGKRAGSQGTAVKGGKMPGMPNRPAGKKVETPSKGAGKPSEYCSGDTISEWFLAVKGEHYRNFWRTINIRYLDRGGQRREPFGPGFLAP
jgi:hypothetical protein